MIRRSPVSLLTCSLLVAIASGEEDGVYKPVDGGMLTRWAKDVRPGNVWPEYPRPQMVRPDWLNLNGLWNYAITSATQTASPTGFDGHIMVPFCVESALSGVKRSVQPDQALWYRRSFEVPPAWKGQRVLLHFGAVDFSSRVWLNGSHVGDHQGGYDPFMFDVTDALALRGPQTLVVRVIDPTDTGWQPRGKQVLKPRGIWYTAVTGIWQTVWLEPVPENHIRGLKITTDIDRSEIQVGVDIAGGGRARIEILDGGRVIAEAETSSDRPALIGIPKAKLWSPDSPHLYDLKVRLISDGATPDRVRSYFGMRSVSLGKHEGHTRIFLNGRPLFMFGPLDQGWWPDGLYTAPSDEALWYDLEVLKRLGMNMLRKHVKVEPARFYYHCDRLGLLVWQDMPSGDRYIGRQDADIERSPESAEHFERELKAMIDTFHNHPSVIMWVVYNEGWGQWDTKRLADWVKRYDPTRLVNSASGWTDRGVGDVIDVHAYPGPVMQPPESRRASVLGEFGGLGWPVADHLWWNKKNWGYRTFESQAELQRKYVSVVRQLRPLIGRGLSAAVYTQTSDVEGEVNGLMTYDREILKIDPRAVVELHRRLYLPPPRIKEVVPTSLDYPQTWRYTFEQPAVNWTESGFDDSSWKTGKGMFGREGTPGVRVGTAWTTADIWLRRVFHLDRIPQGDLRLNVYHDEDAEVYINGAVAGSFTRWITSHILADLTAEGRSALKKGPNVLAVHCHQSGGGQGVDVGLSAVVEVGD